MSTIEEHRPLSQNRTELKIIDCDVHPTVKGGMEGLYPYMTKAWHQRLSRKRASLLDLALTMRFQHPRGSAWREDTREENGDLGGTDPVTVIKQHVGPTNTEFAILNSLQASGVTAATASVDESNALASAFNDFYIDKWLSVDKRYRYAMIVPSQDIAASVAEIRRIGSNPGIAAIQVPLINILMGNRYYWPIYEEAQKLGLPIFVHPSGGDQIYLCGPGSAGGNPDNYIERYCTLGQIAEANLNSLILSGTFEQFPHLKVMFVEWGFAWVLHLTWRMDRAWRALRYETPWVKKWPSEYINKHVRLSTQPIDEPRDPTHLEQFFKIAGMDIFCFATDFPHWDGDYPGQTLRFLSETDRKKYFYENAAEFLRLS
jgi:predicted TIM-barrel fold metal-dependent hydrolase